MRKIVLGGLILLAGVTAQAQDILGRLGQSVERASIHSTASSRSRVLYRVNAYEYLIVRPRESSSWTPVVMEDGRLGFIRTSQLALLPYNVTQRGLANTTRSTAPSRQASSPRTGGTARGTADSRAGIARYALNYIGTPYRWGGNNLRRGVDCSAFVQQLFGRIGVNLPRTAAQQAHVGKRIERLEDLEPGDRLYFWERRRRIIGHTGIYLGNGYFVHSSVNNRGVATDDLRNPKWRNMLVAARR